MILCYLLHKLPAKGEGQAVHLLGLVRALLFTHTQSMFVDVNEGSD